MSYNFYNLIHAIYDIYETHVPTHLNVTSCNSFYYLHIQKINIVYFSFAYPYISIHECILHFFNKSNNVSRWQLSLLFQQLFLPNKTRVDRYVPNVRYPEEWDRLTDKAKFGNHEGKGVNLHMKNSKAAYRNIY